MRDEERRRRERAAAVGGPEEQQRALGPKLLPERLHAMVGRWVRAIESTLPAGVRWRGLHHAGPTFAVELVRGEEATWLLMANQNGPTLFAWRRDALFASVRVSRLQREQFFDPSLGEPV